MELLITEKKVNLSGKFCDDTLREITVIKGY